MGLKVADLYASLSVDDKKFKDGLSKSGTSFGKFGKIIAAGALLAIAAIAAIGVAALKLGQDYDDAIDSIRIGTGATGDDLKALEKTFQSTAKRVPESMAIVGQAIADLNTRTGQTGQGLEDLAVNLIDFSRLTKTDVNANVAAATRLFGDWSIKTEDQSGTLDKLYRTSQATGIGVTDLMETVVNFGSPMRLLGLSFEESIGLLGKWEKEGVNTETAMSGLKFSVKTLANEGIAAADMGEAFREKIEAIKTSADPVGDSIKLFGLRAGPDLAAAILEGRFAVDDLVDVINNGSDTIGKATDDTRDFGDLWGMVSNTFAVSVGEIMMPILQAMVDWFTANMPAIQATMDNLGKGVGAVAEMIGAAFAWLSENVLPVLAAAFEVFTTDVLPHLVAAIRFIVDSVIPALGKVFDWLRTNILPPLQSIFETWSTNVLPALMKAFEFVQKWIKDNWPLISKVISQVAGAVKTAVDIIAAVFKAVMPVIMKVVDIVFPALGAAASVLLQVLSRIFDAIGSVFQVAGEVLNAVVEAIFGSWEGMGTFFSKLFDRVGGIVKGGLNFLISVVNEMIRQINSIQIHIPKIGIGDVAVGPFDWNGVNLPKIPKLAMGTGFHAGGFAVIGENGPELARLPKGTEVIGHSKAAGMMGDAPMIGEQHIYGLLPDEVERQTARALRRAALEWKLEGR